MKDVTSFLQKKAKLQNIYLGFILFLFILVFPVNNYVYQNFRNTTLPIIQKGVENYKITKEDTDSEVELKKAILKFSDGHMQLSNVIGVLLGRMVGGFILMCAIFNLLLWLNNRKFLNLIRNMQKEE